MYSGKIAVPPGGGGIVFIKNKYHNTTLNASRSLIIYIRYNSLESQSQSRRAMTPFWIQCRFTLKQKQKQGIRGTEKIKNNLIRTIIIEGTYILYKRELIEDKLPFLLSIVMISFQGKLLS
jgi:hypothetical protein